MKSKRSYIAAAFNARPLGMPIPPNWFGLAIVGLLGIAVNPAFLLIGAGLEGLYLWTLSQNKRFRAVIDAEGREENWDSRYHSLHTHLDESSRKAQQAIEEQAREIVELLGNRNATELQIGDVRQLAWLHLKLLAARASILQVLSAASRERSSLEEQEQRIDARLAAGNVDAELQRSLEQQLTVIRSRRVAHADAERRREIVDAELERLKQQISLVREQALLATDEHSVRSSLDALSASLNEANRWLKDQRELFAGLDAFTDEAPPPELLQPKPKRTRRTRVAE
jgi:hypothetical protein